MERSESSSKVARAFGVATIFFGVLLGGCGTLPSVKWLRTFPPTLPVESAGSIYLRPTPQRGSSRIADRLREMLSEYGVEIVAAAEQGTAILDIDAMLLDQSRTSFSRDYSGDCRPFRCRNDPYRSIIPIVSARVNLRLVVLGEAVDEASFALRDQGTSTTWDLDYQIVERRVIERVAMQALSLMRANEVEIALTYFPTISNPKAQAAMAAGKFREAAKSYRGQFEKPTFRALSEEERGRVHFNFAQCARVAHEYRWAERALTWSENELGDERERIVALRAELKKEKLAYERLLSDQKLQQKVQEIQRIPAPPPGYQ